MTDIDAIRIALANDRALGYKPTGIDMGYARWERILRKIDVTPHATAPVSELLGLPVTIVPNDPNHLEITYAPR